MPWQRPEENNTKLVTVNKSLRRTTFENTMAYVHATIMVVMHEYLPDGVAQHSLTMTPGWDVSGLVRRFC